jgi:hypothetical protein
MVLSARYSVLGCCAAFIFLLFQSCGEQPLSDSEKDTNSNFHGTPTAIGGTGLTIDLVEGYAIDSQIDSVFKVYYFKPTAQDAAEDEAGIYFGPRPDTSAPNTEYTKKLFDGQFMGNAVKWTEYVTATYTQREVFVDRGPEEKIHCWCYSHDPVTLEKLFWMVKTIK